MLSQRLAKAAQQASQGNVEAFKQLREQPRRVRRAGEAAGRRRRERRRQPAADARTSVRPLLDALDKEWKKTERNAALVIDEEKNLVALGSAVRSINANNPTLLELTDEIAALSVQSGGSARQNAIAAQLMMLTQRMAKNANTMLAENIVDPEVAFLLGKDTNTFRDTLQGLLQGNEALRIARVADAEMRGKLGELQTGFERVPEGGERDPRQQARLVDAKRATFEIFNDSEALLQAAERLSEGYEERARRPARQLHRAGGGVGARARWCCC